MSYDAISSKYKAPVLGKRHEHDIFKFYGVLHDFNDRRCALDGIGVIGNKFVKKSEDLSNVDVGVDYLYSKGTFSVYSEEVNEGIPIFKINPDPIGSCLVYKYEKNGVVAFSSDLGHLVDWLASNGLRLSKSSFYQAIVLSIGDGAFGYTSYEDVYALEFSKYIIACGSAYKILDYGVEDFLRSGQSYDQLLDLAEEDIKKTIKAISETKYEKIAHLTGGMDSRLVVAAINATGTLDSYKIFCSGQKGYPDYDTAYGLCSILGAKMTNKPSLVQTRVPRNFEEYYQWSALDNSGMLPNQPTNIGMEGNSETVVLSGGYGECLRGYHLHCIDQSSGYIANNLWPIYNAQGDVRVPVQESVVNAIKYNLEAFLFSKKQKGWSNNDALQLMYLQDKNRYFVGNITSSYSRYTGRIDPLYSIYAFKAAYAMSFNDRANRKLMFDLMFRFDKQLASAEFGTTSWPEQLVISENIEIKRLPINPEVVFENYESKNNIDWLTKVSSESKAEAIKLGAPAWQVHNYRNIQTLSKKILNSHPEFFESFDRLKVMRLLNNHHNNRQNIRKVFQIYYSLVWLYL